MTLEKADAIIVAATGLEDWRPVFVTGLQTVLVVGVAIGIVLGIVLWSLRK